MQHRKRTALIASLFTLTCLTQIPLDGIAADSDSYTMPVTVHLDSEQKEISPYIYGVNDSGNGANLRTVTTASTRQGGNRYTGYNWETNYSNAGEDWHNSSDTNIGDITDGAGYAARSLSEVCTQYNVPYKITTLQMAGYVAADKNGTVSESEAAPSNRWNTVQFRKDGALSLTPDLTDDTVYMDEYVNYIVQTLGDATTETGIQGYSLDNEPVLWNDTHPLLHSEEISSSELISKSISLASVVKEIDPNAEVFGPAFWGMLPCIRGSNGTDYTDPDWTAVQDNYNWYLDYYLEQMAQAEETYGTRLLDVVDVHYYSQDCSTDAARVQAARSLYDPDYQENSWLQPYQGQYFPFLTRIQESIDQYYPGTKIAFSEYNLGDISNETETGKQSSSAIAEADALGCFGENGVYFATYWGTLSACPYVASAINLYTNYDGNGAAFGDTSIAAETEDISLAYAYAAIQSGDDATVTTVLSNKSADKTEKAVITLDGSTKDYQSAVVYAITPDDDQIRIIDVQNDISNNQVTIELPPMSVAQVVIADEKSDATIYEAPDIQTETITYDYDALELSKNGFPIIPLDDIEHLQQIVLNISTTCSSDSSWYGGGGALTFDHLVDAEDTTFWGAKSFQFGRGTADVTIDFDDTFTNGDGETVQATVQDTYTELQPIWWRSSTNDESGADVTVTYNTVSLVYVYDNTTETTTTTEATTTTETTTTTTETNVLYGDVDLNGVVDLIDAICLNKNLAGVTILTDTQSANADVNTDGIINDEDAATILQFVILLIADLPTTKQ